MTAPPRTLVSRPPLAVVRVAQPEAKRRAPRAADRRSFDFMGALKTVEGTLRSGGSFARFGSAGRVGAGELAGVALGADERLREREREREKKKKKKYHDTKRKEEEEEEEEEKRRSPAASASNSKAKKRREKSGAGDRWSIKRR